MAKQKYSTSITEISQEFTINFGLKGVREKEFLLNYPQSIVGKNATVIVTTKPTATNNGDNNYFEPIVCTALALDGTVAVTAKSPTNSYLHGEYIIKIKLEN